MITGTTVLARELVLTFLDALNREDFKTAKRHVSEDMRFEGVLGSRNGADAYFADMEKMKLKYEVLKSFQEENDVCVLYNIQMGSKAVFTCGWYTIEHGKINSIKVVFDPRPVLEGK